MDGNSGNQKSYAVGATHLATYALAIIAGWVMAIIYAERAGIISSEKATDLASRVTEIFYTPTSLTVFAWGTIIGLYLLIVYASRQVGRRPATGS
jgi:hypothetical protein